MASKGMKNLFGGLKSFFGKPDSVGKKEEQLPVSRVREMIGLLKTIDLNDPRNRLSGEKIRELDLSRVIRFAEGRLEGSGDSEVDSDLLWIIQTLAEAVKTGGEAAAEGAAAGLVLAVVNRGLTLGEDAQDHADEIRLCREDYSARLVRMIQFRRRMDDHLPRIRKLEPLQRDLREELDRCKLHYQTRRESGELDHPLRELEQNPHRLSYKSLECQERGDEAQMRLVNSEMKLAHELARIEYMVEGRMPDRYPDDMLLEVCDRFESAGLEQETDAILDTLKQCGAESTVLSPAALELAAELVRIHNLKQSQLAVDTELRMRASILDAIKKWDPLPLECPPQITDPTLQVRVKEVWVRYRRALSDALKAAMSDPQPEFPKGELLTELAERSKNVVIVVR